MVELREVFVPLGAGRRLFMLRLNQTLPILVTAVMFGLEWG